MKKNIIIVFGIFLICLVFILINKGSYSLDENEYTSDLQRAMGKSYNVLEYGAKGDGVTDDTSSIQKLIDSIPNGYNATIYFPSGTYIIDGISISNGSIYLKGESQTSTIIKSYSNSFAISFKSHDSEIIYGNGASNFTIINNSVNSKISYLYLENIGQADFNNIILKNTNKEGIGISMLNVTQTFFTNIYEDNMNYGINMSLKDGSIYNNDIYFTNCKFNNNNSFGIFSSGVAGLYLNNVDLSNNDVGIKLTYSKDILISNISVNNSKKNGMYIDNLVRMRLSNSQFVKNNSGDMIKIISGSDIAITNSSIYNSYDYGIYTFSSEDINISECSFKNVGYDGTYSYAIILNVVDGAVISNNNFIYDNDSKLKKYCIRTYDNTNNYIISNNNLTNCQFKVSDDTTHNKDANDYRGLIVDNIE